MSAAPDSPIETRRNDVLGRAELAEGFATAILAQDSQQGLVVAVLGPWGAGKTSFINLARPTLGNGATAVLDFNPWMFSGADQLVTAFFTEIAAELRLRPGLASYADQLTEYGEAVGGLGWLPFVGPWIERGRGATKLIAKALNRRQGGSGAARTKLVSSLRLLARPVVVIIDDIDRLSASETRDIFKLVRLTASFPNVIYLLAFDRRRVEHALDGDGVSGRDYLEKILQVTVDLPEVPDRALVSALAQALNDAVGSIPDAGELDAERWSDVLAEVIFPLVRTMRDVRRYAASAAVTVASLRGRVTLVDVLALEAIRLFAPDAFARLKAVSAALTHSPDGAASSSSSAADNAVVETLLEAAPDQRAVMRNLVLRLFPAAAGYVGGTRFDSSFQPTWQRERRVAHRDYLDFYLERVESTSLAAFNRADGAWSRFGDAAELERYLRALPPESLLDVIAALEGYEPEFRAEIVEPAVVALLNLLPDLPERRDRGLFDLDPRMIVGRVTYRLIRSLDEPDLIAAAVREILPQVRTLSARSELITDVGYRENAGHKLVSEAVAAGLERELRDALRAATVEQLSGEFDLARLSYFAMRDGATDEPEFMLPDDVRVTAALCRSALTYTRSQAADSRTVRTSPRLVWSVLVDVCGSEHELEGRIDDLMKSEVALGDELADVVSRYRNGWRPDDSISRLADDDGL